MKNTEIKMAKMEIQEKDHLMNVYDNKMYRGWYRYELFCSKGDNVYKDTIVRYRMPEAVPIYNGILRRFSQDERMIGIHRMLIGKDLRDEIRDVLNDQTDVEEYLKSLNENEVKDMLRRAERIVTMDCNQIPYIQIRTLTCEDNSEYIKEQIKNYVGQHPDYLGIYIDVLNEHIEIQEACERSGGS